MPQNELYEGIMNDYLIAFERYKNPYFAADAFLYARQRGMCPPAPILDWVASGLQAWLTSGGDVDLDSALGLRGTGKSPAFKRLRRQIELETRLADMAGLASLGATPDEAAMVASDRKSYRWRGAAAPEPSVETLVREYKKHVKTLNTPPPARDDKDVAQFLGRFGMTYDYIINRLKSRH